MTTILVIEDETFLREEISELLELEGFQTASAENGLAGVQVARERLPDLLPSRCKIKERVGSRDESNSSLSRQAF
jgi:CheY-like chemotaxis protein